MPVSNIRIETVGDAIKHGYTIYAHCQACVRSPVLDLHAVAAQVGEDHLIKSLRLKCSQCGGAGSLTLHPPRD